MFDIAALRRGITSMCLIDTRTFLYNYMILSTPDAITIYDAAH